MTQRNSNHEADIKALVSNHLCLIKLKKEHQNLSVILMIYIS